MIQHRSFSEELVWVRVCVYGHICTYRSVCVYSTVCNSLVCACRNRELRRERDPDRVRWMLYDIQARCIGCAKGEKVTFHKDNIYVLIIFIYDWFEISLEGRWWTTLDEKCLSSLRTRRLSLFFFFFLVICRAIIKKSLVFLLERLGFWTRLC